MTDHARAPVRVALQPDAFTLGSASGISRYFAELLGEFERSGSAELINGPFWGRSGPLGEVGYQKRLPPLVARGGLLRVLNKCTAATRSARADILHHTHYLVPPPRSTRTAVAVTVHDMIPELLPGLVAPHAHAHKRAHVMAADLVLCVSQTTRQDLLRIWPGIPGRVIATPLGVSPRFFAPLDDSRATEPRPFVIFVGNRGGYKQWRGAMLAIAPLLTTNLRDCQLVFCGGGSLTNDEILHLQGVGLVDRFTHMDPTDQELRCLYSRAAALIVPSAYEGFGLPILEAFASGCPVVLTDIPVFREIAGGVGDFYNAGDDDDLREVLGTVVARGPLHRRAERIGRAREYAWKTTARKTVEAYRAVIAQ